MKMENLKITDINETTIYATIQAHGHTIRVKQDRQTREVYMCIEDFAKALGFSTPQDMFSSDLGLDAILARRKQHPKTDFLTDFFSINE